MSAPRLKQRFDSHATGHMWVSVWGDDMSSLDVHIIPERRADQRHVFEVLAQRRTPVYHDDGWVSFDDVSVRIDPDIAHELAYEDLYRRQP